MYNVPEGECYAGCQQQDACNVDESAIWNNFFMCQYMDECGECGGDGIPAGDCDCNGNVFDECNVCGGSGIPEGDCDCFGNPLESDQCSGCMDQTACNYNPNVSLDCNQSPDGAATGCCTYADSCGDCDGNIDLSADPEEGAVCDCEGNVYDACLQCPGDVDYEPQSCYGCTDSVATNYDATATLDDGSCEYGEIGDLCRCTDPNALNYNSWYAENGPAVSIDQNMSRCLVYNELESSVSTIGGAPYLPYSTFSPTTEAEARTQVCELVGVGTDPLLANSTLCATGTCWEIPTNTTWETDQFWGYGCPTDINFDGTVSTADLLMLLTEFGNECAGTYIPPAIWQSYNLANPYCVGDFNYDGTVSTPDLLTFLSEFGFICGEQDLGLRNTPEGKSRCEDICDIYDLIVKEAGLVISIEQLAIALDCNVDDAVNRCGGNGGRTFIPSQRAGGSKLPYVSKPENSGNNGKRRAKKNY